MFDDIIESVTGLKDFFFFKKHAKELYDKFSLKKKQVFIIMKYGLGMLELDKSDPQIKEYLETGLGWSLWQAREESIDPIINFFRYAVHIFETIPAMRDNPQMFESKLPIFKDIKNLDIGAFQGAQWSEVELARKMQRQTRSLEQHEALQQAIKSKWDNVRIEV